MKKTYHNDFRYLNILDINSVKCLRETALSKLRPFRFLISFTLMTMYLRRSRCRSSKNLLLKCSINFMQRLEPGDKDLSIRYVQYFHILFKMLAGTPPINTEPCSKLFVTTDPAATTVRSPN